MNLRKLLQDFSVAALAQITSLVLSFTLSFFVPKFLDVEEFGYWQLFIFYASYSGLLTFGLNDGVYLLNGGTRRDEIDKSVVASQFFFGAVVQTLVAVFVAAVAVTCFEGQRQLVVLLFSVYTLLFNLSGYLGYLFQTMNETRLFSFSTIISKGAFFVPLLALLCMKFDSFVPYAASYTIAQGCALAFCLLNARDILKAPKIPVTEAVQNAAVSVSVGIKLMLANISSMLILGTMRFLVDTFWGVEVFGEISFSLSLVNLFIVFVSQFSMVLFPALRQLGNQQLNMFFGAMRTCLGVILPVAYLLAFPVRVLVSWWLPQYADSLSYFSVLLPICIFDSKMSLLGTTFFKVLRKEGQLLVLNACSVVASLVLSLLGILVVNSIHFVLLSLVLVLAMRSVVAEFYLVRSQHVGGTYKKLIVSELGITVFYLGATFLLDLANAFFASLAAYALHLAINRYQIKDLVNIVNKRMKERPE